MSDSIEFEKPLPCPFCGEKPGVWQDQGETISAGHAVVWHTSVSCPNCDARQHDEDGDKERSAAKGIAAWNRRALSGERPTAMTAVARRLDEEAHGNIEKDHIEELIRNSPVAAAIYDVMRHDHERRSALSGEREDSDSPFHPIREGPMTNEDALKELDAIGERMKKLRESMPEDSPLHSVAFQVAAFVGELQADILSEQLHAETPAEKET